MPHKKTCLERLSKEREKNWVLGGHMVTFWSGVARRESFFVGYNPGSLGSAKRGKKSGQR